MDRSQPMNEPNADFVSLMREFRAGSDDAFRVLVERYGHHIYRAVRRKLSLRLRSKFDSADFVQAMWASLADQRHNLRDFPHPDDLVAFLAGIAQNKVVDECRRHLGRPKESYVFREVPLEETGPVPAPSAKFPTASAVAIADEQEARLFKGQRATYLCILQMKKGGATHAEIADKLGLNEKTVQRALKRIARRIAR
jgi:RNA polymerase sigma factor (sigma-70 family)